MPKKEIKNSGLSEKQLTELQNKAAKADEYLSQLKRLAAEFDNYKKRMIKEQSQTLVMASKNLIVKLLPIVDDLERALESAKKGQEAEVIAKGVELTHADIKKLLIAEAVEEIAPGKGAGFDPCEHEAVANVACDIQEDCVVEVMQKGYKIRDHVIRPAMVTVSCVQEEKNPKH